MHAINVVLILGACLLALFTSLFVAGALIHLASVLKEALRAMGGRRNIEAEALQPRPERQPAVAVAAQRIPRRGLVATLLSTRPSRPGADAGQLGWLKTAAVALGGMVIGVAAVTVADNSAWSLHTVVAPQARSVEAAASTVAVSEIRPAVEARLPSVLDEGSGTPTSAPRECNLEAGVVTDCSFN